MTTTTRHILAALCAAILLLNAPALRAGGNEIPGKPQDHPIVRRHFREALQKLGRAVPELSYLSLWTNDSGAGFEHTASLYVGRNGGPYLIREWRNHDKVAEAAGQSIARFLHNLRDAAAELNPDFDVILRLEPFKVEHDHILAGMGPHVSYEAPSLLVRGYSLPYPHPKYPENMGVAGSLFHTTMDPAEAVALAQSRAQGIEPVLHYSPTGVMNHEPLLCPSRLLHASSWPPTPITRLSASADSPTPPARRTGPTRRTPPPNSSRAPHVDALRIRQPRSPAPPMRSLVDAGANSRTPSSAPGALLRVRLAGAHLDRPCRSRGRARGGREY